MPTCLMSDLWHCVTTRDIFFIETKFVCSLMWINDFFFYIRRVLRFEMRFLCETAVKMYFIIKVDA